MGGQETWGNEIRGIEKRRIETRCTSGRVCACEDVCRVGCDPYHLCIDRPCLVWMRARFDVMEQLGDVRA